ncbi:Fibronectin type-III domain-containing protein 3A [Tetrabaena socialis]|uniref:Fibronectin type-III domain-containing protein 3A n=1 Tax=Tetrabaena socialis TaxID=47790 RepID=A0A2J8A3G7_9CHLO|nr:Fibronectin type-III domain-containing protein 3A [Tetrabaena socialis]|eukprot:PNH07060.1 Fibronectin type-III domain-containing protein 3A [Tetrabaena socialis]
MVSLTMGPRVGLLSLTEHLEAPLLSKRTGSAPIADCTLEPMTSNTPSTTSEPEVCVVELAAGLPSVSALEPHSAVFSWQALERVPPGLTPVYAIELQQLESADSNPSSNWVSVYKGDALSCKVDELKSGRRYAVRLCVAAESSDSDSPDGGLEVRVANSDNVFFHTPATVPSAIQPPALAQRARNALKVTDPQNVLPPDALVSGTNPLIWSALQLKWNVPEDPGGVFELTYVLQVSPAPIGLEDRRAFQGFVEVYSGPERSFKVLRLQPGVRYTSRVQAINAMGEGPFSLCSAYTTQATVPAPPEVPQVQTASSTTLTLQWSPPPDNGSPIICYCLERDDGAGGDFSHVYAGPNTLHVVKGLRPGTQYRFRLRADNDEGKSMWSGTTTLSTGAAPPDSPVSLQVVTVGRTSATLAWRAPDDDGGSKVVAFEVELQAKSRAATTCMGPDWLKIFEGEAHACTINSLRPGCAYRVRVRARNGAGWGQWALPVDLTTAADAPEAPLSLQPASCFATTIVITWAPPRHDGGAKVHTYRMEMASADCLCGRCPHAMGAPQPHGAPPYPGAPPQQPQAGIQGYPGAPPPPPPHAAAGCAPHRPTLCPAHTPLAVYAGETVGAELRHLQPGCRYIFRVQAVNAQGASAWTDWAAGATTPDAPVTPGPPAVTGVAATALMLSWQVPPGQGAPVTHFTVEAAPLPAVPGVLLGPPGSVCIIGDPRVTSSLGFRLAYRGTVPACEVRGLEPYNAYAFRLCAHNDVGPSPWSLCAAAITAHAPPTCPQSLSAQAASSFKIVLCWAPPERDFGAPVMSYTVEAAPAPRPGRDGAKPGGGANAAWTHAYTGPACACAAEGLSPGRSYQFRVRAANGIGCGPFTPPLTATTLPAPPSAPGRPIVSARTSSGFRARWDEPEHTYGALVTSYVLELCVAGGVGEASGSAPGAWAVAYNGPEAAAKLSGLQPATRYLLRAAAVNAAGQGPFGEAEAVGTTLLPPQPPSQLEVAEVAEQQQAPSGSAAGSASWADLAAAETAAVSIVWQEPAAAAAHAGVLGYEVVAAPRPGSDVGCAPGGGVARMTVAGRRCEARLEGLALGCQYGVRVRAVGVDAAGHSGWTEEVAFATPAVQPDAEVSSPGGGGAAGAGGAAQRVAAGAKGAAKKLAKKQAATAAATAVSAAAACGSSDEAAATTTAAANGGQAGGRTRAKPTAAAARVAAAVTTVAAKTRRKPTLVERMVDETPPAVGRCTEVVVRCVFGPAWRRDHSRLLRIARSLFCWTLGLVVLAFAVYWVVSNQNRAGPGL